MGVEIQNINNTAKRCNETKTNHFVLFKSHRAKLNSSLVGFSLCPLLYNNVNFMHMKPVTVWIMFLGGKLHLIQHLLKIISRGSVSTLRLVTIKSQ